MENDRLVTIREAAKELEVGIIKFFTLVDINKIIGLQSLKFGINVYLPHSEVLRIKINS